MLESTLVFDIFLTLVSLLRSSMYSLFYRILLDHRLEHRDILLVIKHTRYKVK